MTKTKIHAFREPLIINLNRLLQEETNYHIDVIGYEVLQVYKSDQDENTVVLGDCYDEYEIKIEEEKTNILIVTLEYNAYPENGDIEFWIESYQLFTFDNFPEDSPVVLAEPKFVFCEGEVCDYCNGYIDEEDCDDYDLGYCECSIDYIEREYVINTICNNFRLDELFELEDIIYIISYGKFYVLTEKGMHSEPTVYKITEKLAQHSERSRVIDYNEQNIKDRFDIGKNAILELSYNFSTSSINGIVITLTIGNSRINLTNKIDHFTSLIDKELLKDFIRFYRLIEEATIDKELGFYDRCMLSDKELVKVIPNDLLLTVKKIITNDILTTLKKVNVDKINEIEINVKHGRVSSTDVIKTEDKITLVLVLRDLKNFYQIKTLDKMILKQFFEVLNEWDRTVNSYNDVTEKRKRFEDILKLI